MRLTHYVDGEAREDHSNDTRQWKNGNRACMEKLAAYEDFEEQNRLITLPCAIGDTVYRVRRDGCGKLDDEIEEFVVLYFYYYGKGHRVGISVSYYDGHIGSIGRNDGIWDIFLTRKEAEAALEEDTNHEN